MLRSLYVSFSGMFATLFGLFFFHGKQREAEREKRMQYWREQVCLTGVPSFPTKLMMFADCFPSKHPADERNREALDLVSGFFKRA